MGSRSQHGAQLALQHVFLRELRVRARELRQEGSIHLDADSWQPLMSMVGLRTPLNKLLDAWVAGNDNTEPFLVKLPGDRWTLASDHDELLRFILGGEAKSEAGRRRQRRGRQVP